MIEEFDHLTSSVMEYITELNRCEYVVHYYNVCYAQLREYLVAKQLTYSLEIGENWLDSKRPARENTIFAVYKAAVRRINSLILYGRCGNPTIPAYTYCYKPKTTELNEEFSSIRTDFYDWTSKKSKTKPTYCSIILGRFQDTGIFSISAITYAALLDQISIMENMPYKLKTQSHSILRSFLQFLFERGLVSYGYTVFVDCEIRSKGSPLIFLSDGDLLQLRTDAVESGSMSLDDYLKLCDSIYLEHVGKKYSKAELWSFRKIMNRLYLFMDANGLRYTPLCGEKWLELLKTNGLYHYEEICEHRRFLCLLETRRKGIDFPLKSSFVFKKTLFTQLPQWCKPVVVEYLDMKRREGWAKSTMTMFNSCICRFCIAIDSQGIRDFSSLTAEDIKRFNETDIHQTPAGKNAVNSRIRRFLEYLGEKGKLASKYLFLALPSVSAPKETLVVILTEEEQKQLSALFQKDNTDITLREKAMLQLGLYMGLRASDVIKLAIDDIDWNNVTLRVLQQKTGYEIVLPMPVHVANALYRYIMEERPKSDDRRVFLESRAPYDSIERSCCGRAMSHALPDRNVYGSGFHSTRKTYATNLLRNDVGRNEVSEALGQRNPETVNKYLYLDEERIRLCGFSLADGNLTMKGGF
ncbi:MAG: tyrosine-type recombinase/integrase [Clostridia bacterium]|nr:tyrosine-type recombinase/integrase [Clostridia bacterium]